MPPLLKVSPLLALVAVAGAASLNRRQSSTQYLFAFGDSYTQTGFDINGNQPNPSDPTGNPAIGTDTWSGGPNYVEFLTVSYNNTYVQTYNFGYGGATISDSVVATDPSIHSFEEQVEQYYEPKFSVQGSSSAPWSSDDAIFITFFGINDIDISYDGTDMTSALVSKYFSLYDNLHSTGATKFLLVGVPPVDRSPAFTGHSSDDLAHLSDVINEFNGELAAAAGQWQSSNSGTIVSIYDFHAFMTTVLDNPTAYGFQDATCSGDGTSACVWWDQSNLHTTSTFQNILAQNMLSALGAVGW